MFRFESPQYLWLLWLVVVLVAVRYYSLWRRQKKITRIGDKDLVRQLMPDASTMRRRVKFWLTMAAVAVLVVVIARPQMGSKISNDKRNGIETIICLDISNSMLAQDVAPSRLDKSKMLVENLVDNFSNDKIGLVVFAGDAFVQLPITSDYVSAKMFLQGISPALISTQGTDIARAISVASSSFTQQQGVGKAIIVITDGEDHEGGALDAAKEARKKGINVFILGIGSTKGSPIPVGGGEYIRDNAGNIVMSALNEDMCRDIARAGNAVSESLQKCPALLLPQASPQILLLFLLRRLLRTEGDSEYRSWFSLPLLFYTLLYYIDHFLAIFEPFFPLLTQLFVFLGFPQLISRQT